MSENKVTYTNYLKVDELLACQKPLSFETDRPAHDEMLFIVIHQVYELWFKQILFEFDSVIDLFQKDVLDDEHLGRIMQRVVRCNRIMSVLVDQVAILETMTPMDFLDFRDLLGGSSGFQSIQFRIFENKLGLRPGKRVSLNEAKYYDATSKADEKKVLEAEKQANLFAVVERWLERTPFVESKNFDFLAEYRKAVTKLLEQEKHILDLNENLTEEGRQKQLKAMELTAQNFETIFDEKLHEEFRDAGKKRLSYRATLAALLIFLYRDQPALQMPFRILNGLMDFEEHLTTWRYKHALLAHRMLGSKMGTGGSSGFDYLKATAERHRVFIDFANLSTFLVPRSMLPELPNELKEKLGFRYSGDAA